MTNLFKVYANKKPAVYKLGLQKEQIGFEQIFFKLHEKLLGNSSNLVDSK